MRGKFTAFLLCPQVVFIILFGVFVEYDDNSGALDHNNTANEKHFNELYPMFQDVHVMILVGFGFLMTFLKRYGYGSVGFNFMLAAFVIQWAILIRGFLATEGFADGKINLSLDNLLNADFACGAILISFGAVLGVLSPVQLIVMAVLEVVFYSLNELIIIDKLKINDIGGSLVIHAFGAYFGLAVSIVHWREELKDHSNEGSVYHSDIFAMIGTLFLWIFWPSFNAAPAAGTMMGQRAVITTLLSLAAATMATFALSSVLDKKGKLSMVHVQNATLAGGVAVGSVANLKLGPLGAIIVGSCAGLISVSGYVYITPALQRYFKLHDTCGVNNLHGMPGILSAIVAIILARYSTMNTFSSNELRVIYPKSEDDDFNFAYQSKMQLAGLAVTLAMSIFSGLFTGFILKIPFLEQVERNSLFDDYGNWQMGETNPSPGIGKKFEETPMMVLEEKSALGDEPQSDSDGATFEHHTLNQEQTPLTTTDD